MTGRPWYQDRDRLAAEVAAHGSVSAAARANGTAVPTVSNWATKYGIVSGHKNSPGGGNSEIIDPDTITHTLPEHPKRESDRTVDELLDAHGFSADEFALVSATDNYWQGPTGDGPRELQQSKITVRPLAPPRVVLPARTDAPLRFPPKARKATQKRPQLIALPSDPHCPHEDTALDACWLEWCRRNQPDRILNLGDLINLSKPSRHRPNLHEKHNDEASECFQAGHDWWRRVIKAAPDAQCGQAPGNHCVRAQIACMEKLPDLYDVRRPGEEHPWWDLEYLLGLDKLGVEYHRPEGEYHAAEIQLAKGLTVTHGTGAGPVGGAVRAAPRHEGSRIVGHDHKQALTHVVRYRDGEAHTHVMVSAGTMARRDLGYTPNPDAQQGFATVVLHANGQWNVELARFDSRRGALHWRDQMIAAG